MSYEIADNVPYLLLARLRQILANKYNGVKVYVDDMNGIPATFVIKRKNSLTLQKEYSVDWRSTDVITPTMNQKWPPPVPSDEGETSLCLSHVRRIFENITKIVTFDRKTSQWVSDIDEAVPGSLWATAVNKECHQSRLPEKKAQVLSEEKECRSNKPKHPQEGLSAGQGLKDDSQQKSEVQYSLVRATLRKYQVLNISERLISALLSQMRNSCGRDVVAVLLECACAIVFGSEFQEDGVFVYQVGTSNYPFEGFPVSSMSEMINDNCSDVEESPSPSGTGPIALEFDGQTSPSNDSGSASPGSSNQSFGKGFIYPDLIVACKSGGSAKYLMIVEVKSSACPPKDEAQFLRQMVGASVGQEVVYGLVISHLRASLLKICRDDEGSVICCDVKRYDLLRRPLRASPSFNNEKWFDMFMDIIKVLDYARQNIMLL